MKKILRIIVLASIMTISLNASFINALKPELKVGNVKFGVGQSALGDNTENIYKIELGGNYYYNNGIMFGTDIGLSYMENSNIEVEDNTMGELNVNFKLGYLIGDNGYGLSTYGLVDFSYLVYNRIGVNSITNEVEDTLTDASGIGYGVGIDYRFKNNFLLSGIYTETTMEPEIGEDFKYKKSIVSLGYAW